MNNITALAYSKDGIEAGLNASNLGTNLYNTAESLKDGIISDHLATNIAQLAGLSLTASIGVEVSHQSMNYQTLGSGGIYANNLTVHA